MKKRAQSGVITAVLLIVIVIVLVVIVFNVVYGIVKKNTSSADSTDAITTDLQIKQTKLFITGGAQVNVYRGAGEGTITGLKFIFENKNNEKKIITKIENVSELQQKNFVFTNEEIGYSNSEIKAIYVAPIYGDKIGKEIAEPSSSYIKDAQGNRIMEVPTTSSTGSPSSNTAGLVSWWKFDGNLQDSVGGNSFACSSCPTSATDYKGRENLAYRFDGLTTALNVQDNPRIRISSYTVSVWIKPLTNSLWGGIFGKPGRNFNIWYNNQSFIHHRYRDGLSTNSGIDTPMGAIANNEWSNIIITNDGATSKTYINGIEKASGSVAGLLVNQTPIYVGVSLDNGQVNYFNGSIDNIMLFNRSLSASEVDVLYKNQL